jgi:DNA-binding NarL/FixJ family response regulator
MQSLPTAQIRHSAHQGLWANQAEIVALLSCGASNREIARSSG